MQTPVIVSIISAVVALLSAVITILGQSKSIRLTAELARLKAKEDRRAETETRVARYREPLAQAAYDLQSRLYNILRENLLGAYLHTGNKRERSYVINNTVFLIAQYFGWTEIIRREIQFIDLGEDQQNRSLAQLRDQIYSIWQTDRAGFGRPLRVWAGEQRAIGEQMIHEGPRGPECIGYAKFLDCLKSGDNPLIKALQADMAALDDNLPEATGRLAALQSALIDLLAFLDPENIRFPADKRTKVMKMITESNKALVRRWFEEVWNNGRAEAIEEMFAPEGIAHGLSDDADNPLRGPAGFKPFHETFRGAFPDIEVVVEDLIAEGDKVAARCSVRGKHAGDHLGIAASHAPVEFTGITIVRVKDGKIVEAWNNFDFMKMNKQIGAI